MAAYEILLLNTAIPQIQAAQSGDTYLVPRDIAINATAIISANSATDALRITQTGAGNAILVEDSTNPDSTPFVVTATGDVGIGTTSPAQPLDVVSNSSANAISIRGRTADDIGTLNFSTNAGSIIAQIQSRPNGNELRFLVAGARSQTFYTNGSEQMRLDSSGNLGLGVTPSAWGSGFKAIDIGPGSALSNLNSGTDTVLTSNSYRTSTNWVYKNSQEAGYYRQAFGTHSWFTAPSGTANTTTITNNVSYTIITSGNQTDFGAANNNVGTVFTANASGTLSSGTVSQNISFTQAMTLDASGRLLVKATSNTGTNTKLAVGSGLTSGNAVAYISTEDVNVDGVAISNWTGSATTNRVSLAFDSSGVGSFRIGMPGGVNAFQIYDSLAGAERARITSGGYFKASNGGTYQDNAGPYHELYKSADNGDWAAVVTHAGATAGNQYGLKVDLTGDPNGAGNEFLYCEGASTLRASIRSNGGIANYQANDANLSDRREKTNFAPAKSYLDTICAIPVQTFNYIDQSEDDPGLTLGVVAQDVQAVAPELVTESNWGTKDDPKMRLSIYQTDLQYALMKCIQELKSELDSVKAELATLKGA